MHLPLALVVTLATSTLAIPAPTPVPTPDSSSPRAALRGSARNVYLTTCTTRSLSADSTSSSAILYNSGDTSSSNPSDVGTVLSESAIQWAGYTRRVPLGSGIFESKIDKGAETLEKSQIAGSAKLRREQFVCFRDGVSTFRFAGGVLGAETTVCTAEFWCASIAV
ncbi:hypothetical protein PtrSN002B_009310 [Pyrenophora tritici-repentis]|uniref:Atrophin-1 multi-domain protein n=1 Tax=Pyrenophora tritici-repentis TaxID=45151 RepID=A0A2W1D9G2_9PLEO|nr:hypothetical protein PtrV1_01223 [Pyrenophora tritici-repentis]KAF7453949.1 hypothetical protein A1F99_012070 [Pyrenophora tritici-repentis]KAF7577037.1 Atrophin-1 multi-domain protein [Pyrenophora tritici-repentis]KAI1520808.1 hypothetical protein Ptr86124_001176 [Pyrenophora tritici-repentis]KAI1527508.1 hypothetical protein PtrSN001A_009418 [Pyrenophora tritici-repentis]